MTAPSLKIWGNSIGAFAAYGSTDGGTTLVPLKLNADGELVVNLEAATVNIGDVDVASLPSGNLGAQSKAASLCVNPASDISDATYIGDIKFGESLPAGTALMGMVGIDQVTANANEVVVKSITAGTNNIGKVGTSSFKFLQSFTRPADGNAYSAGDAITNSTSSPAILSQALSGAVAGQFVVITNARVISNAATAGMGMNLWCFGVTFAGTNDNAALSIDDTTAATGGVVIPCNNYYSTAANARCVSDPGYWIIQLAAADTKLYVECQASAGYTPGNGETYYVVIEGHLL